MREGEGGAPLEGSLRVRSIPASAPTCPWAAGSETDPALVHCSVRGPGTDSESRHSARRTESVARPKNILSSSICKRPKKQQLSIQVSLITPSSDYLTARALRHFPLRPQNNSYHVRRAASEYLRAAPIFFGARPHFIFATFRPQHPKPMCGARPTHAGRRGSLPRRGPPGAGPATAVAARVSSGRPRSSGFEGERKRRLGGRG